MEQYPVAELIDEGHSNREIALTAGLPAIKNIAVITADTGHTAISGV
jgi:hypothetical protein